MNFWRVVDILNKRKWLILLSMVVASALTAGASRLVGSKWVGTVQLMVPQNAALTASTGTNDTNNNSQDNNQQMQASKGQIAIYTAIARSQNVIKPALEKLNMTRSSGLAGRIEITSKGPRLFELAVSDTSPERATALANGIAEQFVMQYQALNSAQAENTVNVLNEQLRVTDRKLTDLRKRYDQYRSDHQINGTLANTLEMGLTRLKENRHKKDELTQQLAEVKAQLQTLVSQPLPHPAAPIAVAMPVNPEVIRLQREISDMERKVTDLRSRYTDSWPDVKKAVAQLDDLKTRLTQEQAKPVVQQRSEGPLAQSPEMLRAVHRNALQESISGYEAKMLALDNVINSAQAEVDGLKGIDGSLSALTAQIAEQAEMRNALVSRIGRAEMIVDATKSQNPISVMDKVSAFNPPVNSTAGRTQKLTLIGGICALVLTCAILLALDSVDRRLKTVSQAEVALPVRVIAAIPQPMGQVTYDMMARATELEPQSFHAEAFHFLGMHILNQHPQVRSLMVLSAKAEQGSTTALTNLGITLAQAGKRVILVDANIRTSELHKAFNLPNTYGFTDLVANPISANIQEALQPTSVENLTVISSGAQPGNPWEMFRSPKLTQLASQLREQADYVLYDTPSALMFTDALNLAPVIDGAFLCVRALQPLTGSEERMVNMVKEANVTLLGGILTDVPASVIEGYQNYQHYYAPQAGAGRRGATTVLNDRRRDSSEETWIALAPGPDEDEDIS